MQLDLAIIGGGASGMAAAIAAKQRSPQLRAAIFEKNNRVGKKLLATGNGRCNLTNRQTELSHYHGRRPEFVLPALSRFDVDDTLRFFASLGIVTAAEPDGKCYPRSYQAAAVLDCLRARLEALDVPVLCDCEITAISHQKGRFLLQAGTETIRSKAVLLAAGGPASPSLGGTDCAGRLLRPFGHRVTELLPSIVQLKTETEPIRGLSGLKVNGTALLVTGETPLREESGEILFTDYGLSGPPILQLSGDASRLLSKKRPVGIRLNLLPEYSERALQQLLAERAKLLEACPLESFLVGLLPKRVGQAVCRGAGLSPLSRPAGTLTKAECRALTLQIRQLTLSVTGTNGMKNAQVTAGGLDTADFDAETMMSRRTPGLFCCGEALDVDGDCGGFNLQWAWSSGRLAGESAAAFCGR